MTGLEAGHIGIADSNVQVSATVAVSTLNPRTGTYHLRAATSGVGNPKEATIAFTLLGAPAEAYSRSFVRIEAIQQSAGSNYAIIVIRDNIGTRHLSIYIDLNSRIAVARGDVASAPTLLATGTTQLVVGTYYQLEVRVTIDDAVGICQVRINGALEIDFTGDTRNAGNANIGQVDFGVRRNSSSNTGNNATIDHDDIAINDTVGAAPNNTWPGNTGIYGLVPTGAGTYTELATLVGAATHWQAVSEIPPDDAVSYVADTVVDRRDTFAMGNMPVAGDVRAVQWLARAIQDVAGAASIARMYRIGGVDYQGADQAITAAWAYYREILALSPATAAAWTIAEIDGMEAGVRVR